MDTEMSFVGRFNRLVTEGRLEEAQAIYFEATSVQGYPDILADYMRSSLAEKYTLDPDTSAKGLVRLHTTKTNAADNEDMPIHMHHPCADLLRPESGIPRIDVGAPQDIHTDFQKNKQISSPLKTIAFYLPQFHPFPENDQWWGKGFTEWSNVGRALPLFNDHYQPHCPIHLGYYDLRIAENMIEQASLAKNYGIDGFAYYFYWFHGKTLMETPLLNMLGDPRVQMPFCLAWANENWTRRWDGLENDILISQEHSLSDSSSFFLHILKYLQDPRYINYEGKPVLIVYRPDIIPQICEITELWRKMALDNGLHGLYLLGCETFGTRDARGYGFDASVEFPPHAVGSPDISSEINGLHPDFQGHIYDYNIVASNKISEPIEDYPKHYTVMLGWDNTARKQTKSHIFYKFNLVKYKDWLQHNLVKTIKQYERGQSYPPFTFINAWNEWAEGTHLEPDRKFGYSYLAATYKTLSAYAGSSNILEDLRAQSDPRLGTRVQKKNCAIIHCHYIDVLEHFAHFIKPLSETFDVFITTTTLKSACRAMQILPGSIVEVVPNIGRDVAPFLATLNSLRLADIRYNACLKIHTKKTIYRSDGADICATLISSLLNAETVKLATELLKFDASLGDAGMLCPRQALISHGDINGYRMKYHHANIAQIERITGLPYHQSVFPAGSMFWFSQPAMNILLPVGTHMHPPEIGLADGTIAHTIERLFATAVQFSGLRVIPIE